MTDTKACSRCDTLKPAAAFNRNGGGLQSQCRACHREVSRDRYRERADVRARVSEQQKAKRDVESDIDRTRRLGHLRRSYLARRGITETWWASTLEAQSGKCGACLGELLKPVLDHDHVCCPPVAGGTDGKCCGKCWRGIICWSCNVALGHVRDDAVRLRRLADYIERGRIA